MEHLQGCIRVYNTNGKRQKVFSRPEITQKELDTNKYALVGEKWYQLENYYNNPGHDDSKVMNTEFSEYFITVHKMFRQCIRFEWKVKRHWDSLEE